VLQDSENDIPNVYADDDWSFLQSLLLAIEDDAPRIQRYDPTCSNPCAIYSKHAVAQVLEIFSKASWIAFGAYWIFEITRRGRSTRQVVVSVPHMQFTNYLPLPGNNCSVYQMCNVHARDCETDA
jgi:hypothetical protein